MHMLPNLRLVPVGGVFFAILILTLNFVFSRQDDSRARIAPVETPAYGALQAQADHPEWRQFVMLAAFNRAGELDRLRQLPDTPTRVGTAPEATKVAAVPDRRDATDADGDSTGSIGQEPDTSLPVDIGEASSTELPVADTPEQPPVIRVPQSAQPTPESETKPAPQSEAKPAHRARRARRQPAATPEQTAAQPDGLQNIFGGPAIPTQQPQRRTGAR
jgi:hypothetical protein